MLLATLENQNLPVQFASEKGLLAAKSDSMTHILVLGSGYETDDRLSFNANLNTTGLARLTEGIRLHLLFPGSKLIFSGHAGNQPLPEAVISAQAAQELGIQSNNIITNCNPWNTKSEAAEYFKRFGTSYKLYLVTDAAHMPRALMHFRYAGLNPVPVPTISISEKTVLPKVILVFFLLPAIFNTWKLYLRNIWECSGQKWAEIERYIYQITDDEALSTNEIIRLIAASQSRKSSIWNISKKMISLLTKTGDIFHLPLNSERLKKLTELYIVSNQKIKNALGIEKMPITSKEGFKKTFESFQGISN